MSYIGDFNPSAVIYGRFTTVGITGAPTTLAGTPALSVYKTNSTTQTTTGVSLSVDHDSVTGLHLFTVDTSADGTFYAAGCDFQVVITTGTVGGTSVVGYVVSEFSIENRNIKANVTQFGGSNGTFSSGRPEVNTTHIEGTDATDQIRDAAAAALVVHRLDELLNADSDIDGAAPPTVGSVFHELMSKSTGSFTYNQTTDSLEAIRDTGDASWATPIVPTAADIADAVWDEGYGGHQTNGTFGKIVTQIWSSIYAGGGTVDSTGATASSFRTDIVADDDFYNDMLLTFTSGALSGQTRPIADFTSTNGVFTFDESFAAAPANGVTFALIRAHIHPISQIQSGLATAAELAKVPKSDSNVTWNATALASIQSEAEDAIVVHRLDELLNADSDIDGAAPPTVGSVIHELMSKTAGSFTYDQTTDSLEALRDRGDAAWITATGFSTHSAADVWSVATRVLTAGTNIVLAKGTGITGFTDIDAATVRTQCDDALVAINLDHLVKSAVDTNFATTVHLDSVIGQLADDGTTATFDRTTDSQEAIRNRGDLAWLTATGFSTHSAADVWSVATRTLTALDEDSTTLDIDGAVRAAVGLGSANLDTQLGDIPTNAELATALDPLPTAAEIRAEIDSNSTQLAAIVADTNELQSDWVNGGRLDVILDARASQTSVNTAQADLDILTGSDGATLATSQPNYAPATAAALTTVGNNVSAILADTGTDGVVLSTATLQSIADTLLARNVSNVEGSAPEHSLTAIVLGMLESSRSGTTWTIKRTDGSTTFATKTLTVDAAADPITGVT